MTTGQQIGQTKTQIDDVTTDILIALFEQRDTLPELEDKLHSLRAERDRLYEAQHTHRSHREARG